MVVVGDVVPHHLHHLGCRHSGMPPIQLFALVIISFYSGVLENAAAMATIPNFGNASTVAANLFEIPSAASCLPNIRQQSGRHGL